MSHTALTPEDIELILGAIFIPSHGTYGGFQQHRILGIKPCEPCREANKEYYRAYRLERRKAAQ